MNFHNHHHHFGRPPRPPPQTLNASFAGSPSWVLFSGVPPYTALYGNATHMPPPPPLPSQFDPQFSSYGGIHSQASLPSERRILITVDSLFQTNDYAKDIRRILSNVDEQMNIRTIVENGKRPAYRLVEGLERARLESLQHAHEVKNEVEANMKQFKDRVAEAEQRVAEAEQRVADAKKCVADAENELQQIDRFKSTITGPFFDFERDLQLIIEGLHVRPKPITFDNLTKAQKIKAIKDLTNAPLEQIRSLVWCSTFECVEETDRDESYAILTFLDKMGAIQNPSIQDNLKEYHRNGVISNGLTLNRIRCDTQSNLAMRQGLIAIYLGLVPAEAEYRGFFLKRGHPNLNPWASMNASAARTNETAAADEDAAAPSLQRPTPTNETAAADEDAAAPSLQRTLSDDYGVVEGGTLHLVTTTTSHTSAPTAHRSPPAPAAGASAPPASNVTRPNGTPNLASSSPSNAGPGSSPAVPSASGAPTREAAFLASGAPTELASEKRSATSATTTAPLPFSASGTESSPSPPSAVDKRSATLANGVPTERLSFDVSEMTLPNGQDLTASKVADNVASPTPSNDVGTPTPPEASTADSTGANGVAPVAPIATEAAKDAGAAQPAAVVIPPFVEASSSNNPPLGLY